MPASNEGIKFDEMGICQACQSAEQKIHIDWVARERELRALMEAQKALNNDYDCIVPISGGKDSTFQLYMITQVYGMRPLAVTFSHNWFTETGRYNLQNAIDRFGVDHVMMTPSRAVIEKLARKSLFAIGDSCWHCHAGVGAFPLQMAVKYRIPMLIWGESIADLSGRSTYKDPIFKFDRDYFTKVSAKVYPEAMLGDGLTERDLAPYKLPTYEEIDEIGVFGIHLGDYVFWDDERQMEFVRDHFGWREDRVEGTYKRYKSVECRMAGVHDYTKFLKRGFGRGTDHASADVRAGLLTQEEGFALALKHDTERPAALDYYLEITGFTEEEFEAVLAEHRRKLNVDALSDEAIAEILELHQRDRTISRSVDRIDVSSPAV